MRIRRRLRAAVAFALMSGALVGCSSSTGDGISVVTSVYPLQWVAERVGGDLVDVTNLTRPGQEPHDLELTVRETAEVSDADVVVYARGFQAAVDEAVATEASDGTALDALQVMRDDPPAIPGARPVRVLPDDPHFWLDPRALATVATALAGRLEKADPDHAATYRENLQGLVADLVGLDGRTAVALQDCARRTVVTTHEAFGYFGYRYDLDFVGITGLSPDAEPSPAHLLQLRDLIDREGLTTVFTEELASGDLADTLASELGIRTAVLDPVEGLSSATSEEDYLSLMAANTRALVAANDCTEAS